MARITYIDATGAEYIIEADAGQTLMQAAVSNGIHGIVAECGGNCACGTCRIYIDEAWRERIGEASDIEEATMEGREDETPGRRLSCQIKVTAQMDGLIVRTPESQW
ncbi:MAG TPA: 2Fe-2S iron-sulfur cluster-binding protein [Acidocella sp.]|nr:2Fe-2S iron-sulfur cluster-binding protein [Acidocella sp.]